MKFGNKGSNHGRKMVKRPLFVDLRSDSKKSRRDSLGDRLTLLFLFHLRVAATGRRVVAGFLCRSTFGYFDLAPTTGLGTFISCTFF